MLTICFDFVTAKDLLHYSIGQTCFQIVERNMHLRKVIQTLAGVFISEPLYLRCADIEFSAIIDPNTKLAQQRVADLSKGQFGAKWQGAKVFADYRDLLNSPVRFRQIVLKLILAYLAVEAIPTRL